MRILVVERNKTPYVKEIDGELETMQGIVGGYIQAIYPFEEPIALICNEEGKINNLEPNRYLIYNKDEFDLICGTFFLCSAPSDSDSFGSLNDEQIRRYTEVFEV